MEILRLNIEKAEPDEPSEREVRFQVALLASLTAIAVSLVARFLFDAPLVPELLAHLIFAIAPIWLVEIAIGILGPFAKHLAFLACVLLYLISLIAASALYLRYSAQQRSVVSKRLSVIALSLAVWAVTLLIVLPLLGGGLAGRYLRQGVLFTSASLFVIYAIFGAALWIISVIYVERPEIARRHNNWLGRRRVVRGIAYAVLGVALYDIGSSLLKSWLMSGSGRVRGGDGVFPNINGLALEVTPTPDFYEVSKNPFDPTVDAGRWRLEVVGLVNNPLSLTYDEIKSLPSDEQYATLACISNKVGGDLIGNALWRGVRLKEVLNIAGLKEGVVDIVLRASDDYRDSIPLDRAMAEGTILVYEMNGAALTPSHGFPLRLVVPGIYGMKNVKWVKRIEAVGYDLKGYWQARGWDDRAEYKTMSRIDAPEGDVNGPTTIAGIAFAGDRGVSKVEVSSDGGKSWEKAEIKPALSPFSWVLWHKQWSAPRAGKHALVVRATDGAGVTQTSEYAPPDPSGSSGYHKKTVEAE